MLWILNRTCRTVNRKSQGPDVTPPHPAKTSLGGQHNPERFELCDHAIPHRPLLPMPPPPDITSNGQAVPFMDSANLWLLKRFDLYSDTYGYHYTESFEVGPAQSKQQALLLGCPTATTCWSADRELASVVHHHFCEADSRVRCSCLAHHLHKPSSKTIVIDLGKRAWKPAYFESSLFIIHEC